MSFRPFSMLNDHCRLASLPVCVAAPLFLVALYSCSGTQPLGKGMRITSSVELEPGTYTYAGKDSINEAVVTIEGDDIDIDFAGVVLDARMHFNTPDQFKGVAVRIVSSRNVTIRNLHVHGYKIAVYAENVDSLKLIDCDLSYNYRPRLHSRWDRESLADWLYYHDNENDEWLRYGSAAYLKNCNNALVTGLLATQGFNGLQLVRCDSSLIYNNDIRFNSGLGIGMYRSSNNRIMHNRLDWNVRGYTHGIYQRGQDSAGILLYEQCRNNTIAYNSATHSGDGLFLWAGNQTMDSGEGGCNDNLIYANDFSQSVANAIEVTFSSNIMISNKLNESRYGIWGGYSFQSLMLDNEIAACDYGIAIEHGNNNTIANNHFARCRQGIRLWERDRQPQGWGFAEKRDVSSRGYVIAGNSFTDVDAAFAVDNTVDIAAWGNTFARAQSVFADNTDRFDINNPPIALDTVLILPSPLPDAMSVALDPPDVAGRRFILMNEWGPYNFQYPGLFLRSIETDPDGDKYTFGLFGPEGNWKLVDATGFVSASTKTGSFPATLSVIRDPAADHLELSIECISTDHFNQFGEPVVRGTTVPLHFRIFDPDWKWDIAFFPFPSADSIPQKRDVDRLRAKDASAIVSQSSAPQFRWWRSPAEGVPADKFVTVAATHHNFDRGQYRISIESDDGVRLLVDDKEILSNWSIHESAIDAVSVHLSGDHVIELQHFDAGGLAVLDLEIEFLQ